MRIISTLLTNKFLTIVFCLLLTVISVQAGTLTVTKTQDTNDTVCDADCSLREAIAAAASGDTIVFSTLFDSPQTITLSEAAGFRELTINKDLIVSGKGANLLTVRRDAAASVNFRVFNIIAPANVVNLSGMTITGGRVIVSVIGGGGIAYSNNAGTLIITGCYIHDNSAISTNAGGGGIGSLGGLIIRNSTISNNTLDFASTANTGSNGGGIFKINSGGSFELTNSTVSGNVVTGTTQNDGNGGGVYVTSSSNLISNSTVTDNQTVGTNSASGIYANTGTAIRSTIVAANRNNSSFPDVVISNGAYSSQGFNLIGNVGAATGFNLSSDQTGNSAAPINPQLQPLAGNGGTTPTHALNAGSPALDKGNSFGNPTDQRGAARPVDNPGAPPAPGGDNADIGAFEAARFAALVVTKIEDTNDGVCDSDCSLREAIAAAPRGSEIEFASPLFASAQTITLSDAANFGTLPINKDLSINGKGANLLTVHRDATSGNFRIFSIVNSAVGIIVNLNGMTVSGGRGVGNAATGGGGVYFFSPQGRLTINNSVISNNSDLGPGNKAGGIWSYGALIVRSSSIVNNTVDSTSNNGQNSAGGIYLFLGTFEISNSTVSGNSFIGANANSGGNSAGGIVTSNLDARITNSTITDNGASGATSASGVLGGSNTTVRSSIIAGNRSNTTVPDVQTFNSALISSGYNLTGSAPPGIGFSDGVNNDKVGTINAPLNPRLDPLANYGGTTLTHRLQSNSPAIDAGFSYNFPTDQRGFQRRVDSLSIPNGAGDAADIGAFEAQDNSLAPIAGDDSYTLTRNVTFNVPAPGVLANDQNLGGGTLTAIKLSDPMYGTLRFNANGSFSYQPNPNSILNDSFTYKVNDGTSDSNIATVSIKFDNTRATSNFAVTKITDTNDGVCDADCSLREAISASSSEGVINFASPLFDTAQTITLDQNLHDLVINKSLTINGTGANLLTVQRSIGDLRIFNVNGSGVTVSFNNFAIKNGNSATGNGGGINANGGVTLNINGCQIVGSMAQQGGGIYVTADSTVNISNSTISGNQLPVNTTTGGGIHNLGILTINNSTISGNVVNSAGANGGGIWTNNTTTITNSTITDNQAAGANSASGILRSGNAGTVTISNTIVAANRNNANMPDVGGAFVSNGYNLIGNVGAATGFGATGDQTGSLAGRSGTINKAFSDSSIISAPAAILDPRLDPLGNYGGKVPTHRLQTGSPAIDAGSSFGVTTDQRGLSRPVDISGVANVADGTDIGAFELQTLSPTAAAVSISGRVLTPDGKFLRNALVTLTGSSGNSRTILAGIRGAFRFSEVAAGETYIISIRSKRYQFAPQVLTVTGDVSDLIFTGEFVGGQTELDNLPR